MDHGTDNQPVQNTQYNKAFHLITGTTKYLISSSILNTMKVFHLLLWITTVCAIFDGNSFSGTSVTQVHLSNLLCFELIMFTSLNYFKMFLDEPVSLYTFVL